MNLIKKIQKLQHTKIKKIIDSRLKEFKSLHRKSNQKWFSELCFCLLTANWKAQGSIDIQKELGHEGFLSHDEKKLQKYLKKKGHRFHPQRAERICLARRYRNIKDIISKIKSDEKKREWLVEHVKGLGYKEASHFLRNVGYDNLAIVDRHILRVLHDNRYLKDIPKTITKKRYLEIEQILADIATSAKMTQSELDLYLWFMKTGKVLK